jgi:lipopolysaccharide/colanic/teichoic acid biosynthesis glycosyltransferase
MDYKLTLKKAISEIATMSKTYRDFENAMNHIGMKPEMLHELDIKYIENWTLFNDIKIIFATPFKIINRNEKFRKKKK